MEVTKEEKNNLNLFSKYPNIRCCKQYCWGKTCSQNWIFFLICWSCSCSPKIYITRMVLLPRPYIALYDVYSSTVIIGKMIKSGQNLIKKRKHENKKCLSCQRKNWFSGWITLRFCTNSILNYFSRSFQTYTPLEVFCVDLIHVNTKW